MTQLEKRQLRRIRRYLESLNTVMEEIATLAGPDRVDLNAIQWHDLARHAAFADEHLGWIRSIIRNTIQELPAVE